MRNNAAANFDLTSRVALVTGSSTGLGKAMAIALGAAGAKVAMNFHNNEDRAAAAFDEFKGFGLEGIMIRADVTSEAGVDELATQIEQTLGPIDIAVMNATPDQPQLPIEDYDWAGYQTMLDFFVKSPYLITRRTLGHMKRQRWGRLINIGSEVVARGAGNFSAYVAAKGAQNAWTRSMASELAPAGITVNMIAPGWIPVERHEQDAPEAKAAYLATIPVGRWGVPADLAGAVVYLAGESSSFVTGQTLHINGGMTVC